MAYEVANSLQCLGSVAAAAAGGGVKPTYNGSSPGFSPNGVGADHSATGIYVLALDEAILPNAATVQVTPDFTDPDINVDFTLDVTGKLLTVQTSIADTLDDTVGFSVAVLRRPG